MKVILKTKKPNPLSRAAFLLLAIIPFLSILSMDMFYTIDMKNNIGLKPILFTIATVLATSLSMHIAFNLPSEIESKEVVEIESKVLDACKYPDNK